MSKTERAWEEVGERFARLGTRFKDHYRRLPESDEEIREAVERLTQAADRLMTSIGNAVRDSEVQNEARSAGAALADALETTFQDLGERLQRGKEDRSEEG